MRYRRTSDAEASGLTAAIERSSGKTRRLEDILDRVIPHFESFPLLSGKRYDFARFASVCRLMPTAGIVAATV